MKHKKKPTITKPPRTVTAATRIAIVVSQYHSAITNVMAQGASDVLTSAGLVAKQIETFQVPGAWELPLGVLWACDTNQFAGVIALGAVIKGETSHDEHINRFVSLSLGQISLEMRTPIAFGVLTCNNLAQARERSGGRVGNKGVEAAEAVLAMLHLKQTINNIGH